LAPEIKKALLELGYKRPTDIQFKSIMHILKDEDVLAIAQTGTGKTAAYVIPVLHKLQQKRNPHFQGNAKCIVMVPTHELAIQVTEVFDKIGRYCDLTAFTIYGGVKQNPQINQLKSGVDILVATPGRVFDLVHQGHLRLDRIEILILDEADHMLDRGFLKDIQDLIRFLPPRRQTLFFSATINEKIKKLAYSLVSNAIRIQISPKDPVSKNIEHRLAFVEMDDKRFFLERIINENPESKMVVFVRTKVRAERVLQALQRVGLSGLSIHSDKLQEDREETMKKFSSGEVKVLIATDVSARGIDIPHVDYVVNYDLPEIAENYVHRVGRTGRGTNKGKALSLCSKEEKELLENIEAFTGNKIQVLEISKNAYQETIDFSAEQVNDWKRLISENDDEPAKVKKKKK
jgi:ATP-dependent RNA helicase RhlE